MGEIRKITCKSCGRSWECTTGCGMLHGKLKWVADLYPEDIKKEILSYLKEDEIILFDFGFQLSYCRKCNGIESVPVLRLADDKGVYAGICGQCGQKTELIEEVEKIQCPVCHGADLTVENIGFWD